MAFLFKRNPKTAPELVRALNELLLKLDVPDLRKHHDECARHLRLVKYILAGDGDSEPQLDQMAPLALEMFATDTLYTLVATIPSLDFDLRKDVASVFGVLLRRQPMEQATQEYLVRRPETVYLLFKAPERPEIALVCGQILRDCIKHELVNRLLLEHAGFWNVFKYVQLPVFEVATDSFATLQALLSTHKKLAGDFLAARCEAFAQSINGLMRLENYVTKRQAVRLLLDVVVQRLNVQFLKFYLDDAALLKLVMLLLLDKLKNVQLESFHVFKYFVAKPRKLQKIMDILAKNKDNFVRLFESLDVTGAGSSVIEERDFLMHHIQKLPDVGTL